jgi:hypothetical protein
MTGPRNFETTGTAGHAIVITVDEPAEVSVGDDFMLTVRVSCPAGCDLSGIPIEVTTPDGARTRVEVPPPRPPPHAGEGFDLLPPPHAGEGREGVTDVAVARRIALKAPLQAGEQVWRLSCATHEVGGCHHDASLSRVPVRIKPHETSLAVWAIPSPVVTGQPFAIKVGAKSAAASDLTGMPISVRDEAGAVLASDFLGEKPWPGTTALYWSELVLTAPAEAGMFSWSVEFAAAGLALPHHGASSRFCIAIVHPPEHKLTVKVIERENATPIENAQVRLGAYRAATATSGIAELILPKGSYDVNVWKPGYEAPNTTIAIDGDVAVEILLAAVPEDDPDAAWVM